MRKLSVEPVEENSLPTKYRRHGRDVPYHELITRYEDLKRDYKYALDRVSDSHRKSESVKNRLETEIDLNGALRYQNNQLYEAGRYAVYGKPELSPVDEVDEGEQDSQ